MFSNKLAITWRLFGDSGDYLAILEVIGVFLRHPCASASSAQSVFYPMDNKPQRSQRTQREVSILCALCVLCGRLILPTAKDFDKTTHCKERKAAQQEPLRSGVTKIRYGINNELERTDTNFGHSEFVRVRISSLLTSILFLSLRPLGTLRLDVFSVPAPGVHLRLSRAGDLKHLEFIE